MIVIYSAALTSSVQFNEDIELTDVERLHGKARLQRPNYKNFLGGWVGRLPSNLSLSAGIHAKRRNLY